jgi:hypothetical protein
MLGTQPQRSGLGLGQPQRHRHVIMVSALIPSGQIPSLAWLPGMAGCCVVG